MIFKRRCININICIFYSSDSPSFTKLYYSGSYIINDGIPQLSVEHISLVNNYDDYESVDIFLEEEGNIVINRVNVIKNISD